MKIFDVFVGKKKNKLSLPNRSLAEIKDICHILFIDDQSFKTVKRLKKEDGWKNSQLIKDVTSLDQSEIVDAHIIFVDAQGVAKELFPKDEGLGLICALKDKYPEKKIIMYSAESKGAIDAFHPATKVMDDHIRKNADHYVFQSTLERFAQEIFSPNNCIVRIQRTLNNEFGLSLSKEDIEHKLLEIDADSDLNKSISKVFNIQNAAAIATIIQLFIKG